VDAAARKFLTLDTRQQAAVLSRVGLTTDVGDFLVRLLRKADPGRFRALAIHVPDIHEMYGEGVAA
jgi:hypothetical protein